MSKVIWKFDLKPNEGDEMVVVVNMPVGAQVLTVQMQHDKPRLWALVDPEAPRADRRFQVVGTGHKFNPKPSAHYLGTFQMQSGAFVFHVFEVL